jgi:hypothetical protein
MTSKPTTPAANNHPVAASERTSGPPASYPKVPQDGRIISIDDLGPGRRDPLGYVNTGE